MLGKNLRCFRNSIIRAHLTAGKYIQCQLIVIDLVTDTRVADGHIYTLYWCVDRIYVENSFRKFCGSGTICTDIASARCDGDFHLELRILGVKSCDLLLRIQDLQTLNQLDVGRRNDALTHMRKINNHCVIGG